MQVVFITGVSTGIGNDATRYLLQNGFRVFGSVRTKTKAEELQVEFGEHFTPLVFDVTDDEAMGRSVETIKTQLEGKVLTALINNAGIAVPGPLKDLPIADLRHQMEVNVMAVFNLTNQLIPLLGGTLNHEGPKGKIINISSVSGVNTSPFTGAYSMSKYALESMNDAYRRELMLYGIDVVAIEPGPIKTDIWGKSKGLNQKFKDSDYWSILKKADGMIDEAEKSALPVRIISNRILKIIRDKNPKTRYVIHPKPWLFRISQWLPDRMLDRIIWKKLTDENSKSYKGY